MMATNRDRRERTMVETYQRWVKSLGLPIHRGYYIEDLRTVEMGWWEERGCNTAFIQLFGPENEGGEAKVMGIPPGETTRPWKFALDDVFYVLEGKGLTTIWRDGHSARKTFEWQTHSLFMIPRQSFYQLTNAQGDKPATLLSRSDLPLAMQAVGDPAFFFNNPYVSSQKDDVLEDLYSEAKSEYSFNEKRDYHYNVWHGNFFPDMAAWDKLDQYRYRGAGGHTVSVSFPNSTRGASMSIFPARTYKKGHYHRAGIIMIIPVGEGYSLLWDKGQEVGKERIIMPWHEGSCYAPQMFHQHFNVGLTPARYLKLGSILRGEGGSEIDVEYPDEDPWIRQHFEEELAKRGSTSLMPEEAYKDRNYQWEYGEDKE